MKNKLKYIYDQLEQTLIVFFFAVLILTVFIQIISRVIFNAPLMYTEELSRYLFIWIVFLGMSYITKIRSNVCIEIFTNKLKEKGKRIFDIIVNIVSIAVFIFIFFWSVEFVKFQWINPAPAMRFSQGIVYLICPVAMVLSAVRSIALIVEDIKVISLKTVRESEE